MNTIIDKIRRILWMVCFIAILQGEIVITEKVADEYGSPLQPWITTKNPEHNKFLKLLEQQLDKGEASAIALAVELDNCLLILDDLKSRKYAKSLNQPHRNYNPVQNNTSICNAIKIMIQLAV